MDPRAQEFWPTNHSSSPANQIALFQPHIYYPYPSPPPPPFPTTGLQFTPFYQPSVSSPAVYTVGPAPGTVQASPVVVVPRATAAPTRAVVLSWISPEVTEEGIRRELEVFGAVRAVEMAAAAATDGVVTVHFYDLRSAQAALTEIRAQHMQQQCRLRQHYVNGLPLPAPETGRPGLVAGRPVWAQFTMPETVPVPDGHNQGTIVVFNLDSGVSTSKLKEIFEAFGPVKELRETPLKRHQRFVEFYDVRDAATAIKEMEGKEINGKRVLIEFSRPGGHRRRFSSNTTTTTTYYHDVNNINSAAVNSNINTSSRTSNNSSNSSYYSKISIHPSAAAPVVSKSFRRSSSDVTSNSTCTSSNSYHQLQNQGKKGGFGSWNGNSRRWNYGEVTAPLMASLSIEASENENSCSNGSSSTRRNSSKKRNDIVIINCSSSSSSSVNTKQQQQQHGKQQNRNHRSWKGRHKSLDSQFLINKDAVESNCGTRDTRTTVMIKNIPNKYSQKLLLNMLDNHCIHCNEQIADGDDLPMSSYDFVYLPIDFNNKCNVGYGFVNFTFPEAAWRLYQAFHMQHWEVFNSRKICEITYARLQGLEALKQHFKNSKFACDTDEYLPVVFDPPRDGRQLSEPVAIGGHPELVNKVKHQFLSNNIVGGDSINTSNVEPKEEEEDEDGDMMHDDYEAAHDDDDDGDGGSCGGGDGNDDNEEEEEEESGATTSSTAPSAITPDFATPNANGVLYAQQN